MRIVLENVKEELLKLIRVIAIDAESWRGWHYLCMELTYSYTIKIEDIHDKFAAIIANQLPNMHGTVFIDCDRVHVVCKNVSRGLIKALADQTVEPGISLKTCYFIGDIAEEAAAFLNLWSGKENFQDIKLGTQSKSTYNNEIDTGCKILLIDDDPVASWMVSAALNDACSLMTADKAEKAIDLYEMMRPNLVLLDKHLCGYDGSRILQALHEKDPSAYIVMFSGSDTLEAIVDTVSKGAQGFIAKPFLPETLFHYIHCALIKSEKRA